MSAFITASLCANAAAAVSNVRELNVAKIWVFMMDLLSPGYGAQVEASPCAVSFGGTGLAAGRLTTFGWAIHGRTSATSTCGTRELLRANSSSAFDLLSWRSCEYSGIQTLERKRVSDRKSVV